MREKKPKKSSVRHTRAIQRDRTKRPNTAAPDEIVEARLKEVVHPATLNHVAHFHALGLRARTLNLPVMMAFVLRLIWRQIGSVREAVRTLNREGLLWVDARKVSQQALEQRFSSVPALLFERVLQGGAADHGDPLADPYPATAARVAVGTRPLYGNGRRGWLDLGRPAAQNRPAARRPGRRAWRTDGRVAGCDQSAATPRLV